ncbi:hypothetical protein E3O06_01470 [Cryobacterium glaciale]|uniref:DUF3558 domain-containing protein n=1 Tax=Cryobacterium glaciale TaxID=1259145 RepID=A0A4V3I9T0_9MICO|nr:hypothetical protein [Cryobacterium glaciale]TFB76702.1 hypothetical protein E3O06_01470 [Cryobacterium glaciale]
MRPRSLVFAAFAATGLVTIAACAGDAVPGAEVPRTLPPYLAFPQPTLTSDELVGQGTVLQQGEAEPQLCLGPILESYPPQCSGPTILGWDWAQAQYSETASSVTWGTYAVFGTWDDTAFTQTQPPIPLSLYSPIGSPDPRQDPENAGASDDATLQTIQDGLNQPQILTSMPMNGYLWVSVLYDDGTIQKFIDEKNGPDVVIVQSALRSIS